MSSSIIPSQFSENDHLLTRQVSKTTRKVTIIKQEEITNAGALQVNSTSTVHKSSCEGDQDLQESFEMGQIEDDEEKGKLRLRLDKLLESKVVHSKNECQKEKKFIEELRRYLPGVRCAKNKVSKEESEKMHQFKTRQPGKRSRWQKTSEITTEIKKSEIRTREVNLPFPKSSRKRNFDESYNVAKPEPVLRDQIIPNVEEDEDCHEFDETFNDDDTVGLKELSEDKYDPEVEELINKDIEELEPMGGGFSTQSGDSENCYPSLGPDYNNYLRLLKRLTYEDLVKVEEFKCDMAKVNRTNDSKFFLDLPQYPGKIRRDCGNLDQPSHSRSGFPYVPAEQKLKFAKPELAGKCRALVIGIGYYGRSRGRIRELDGSFEDCKTIVDALTKRFKVPMSQIVVLNDHIEKSGVDEFRGAHCSELPTRGAIKYWMKWLTKGVKSGSQLFFYYAGHGKQSEDLKGEEDDGMNEEILPLDFVETGKVIKDDYIYKKVVLHVPKGCILLAIWDCCHSETNMDLPYVSVGCKCATWRVTGAERKKYEESKEPPKPREDLGYVISLAASTDAGNSHEMCQPLPYPRTCCGPWETPSQPAFCTHSRARSEASAEIWSSPRNSSGSLGDVTENNGGIMTTAFKDVIEENYPLRRGAPRTPLTYLELLRKMRQRVTLRIIYEQLHNPSVDNIQHQVPQLSSSHPFDLRSTFNF